MLGELSRIWSPGGTAQWPDHHKMNVGTSGLICRVPAVCGLRIPVELTSPFHRILQKLAKGLSHLPAELFRKSNFESEYESLNPLRGTASAGRKQLHPVRLSADHFDRWLHLLV